MDRELFSELIEAPIQPAMLHIETLKFYDGLNPNFQLHICSKLFFYC